MHVFEIQPNHPLDKASSSVQSSSPSDGGFQRHLEERTREVRNESTVKQSREPVAKSGGGPGRMDKARSGSSASAQEGEVQKDSESTTLTEAKDTVSVETSKPSADAHSPSAILASTNTQGSAALVPMAQLDISDYSTLTEAQYSMAPLSEAVVGQSVEGNVDGNVEGEALTPEIPIVSILGPQVANDDVLGADVTSIDAALGAPITVVLPGRAQGGVEVTTTRLTDAYVPRGIDAFTGQEGARAQVNPISIDVPLTPNSITPPNLGVTAGTQAAIAPDQLLKGLGLSTNGAQLNAESVGNNLSVEREWISLDPALASSPRLAADIGRPSVNPLTPASLDSTARFTVNIQFGRTEWQAGIAAKVAQMASQNLSFAEIKLDPPELGPLQVRIQMNQDQATVVFNSASAQVREALDQNNNRLRDLFSAEGIDLVDVDVSDQGQQSNEDEIESDLAAQSDTSNSEDAMDNGAEVVHSTAIEMGVDDFV